MNVRRLCVGQESLSRRFLPALALGVIAVFPGAVDVQGDVLQTSKVRFVEHSPAAFDAVQREGKPVFLLISAVWCYWCKYFEQQVLSDVEVSGRTIWTWPGAFSSPSAERRGCSWPRAMTR
jgi:hypothetical protein